MAEVVVTGTITPTDTIADIYATHDALYGKGGLRSVADYTERNAISNFRRTVGMLVYVESTDEYWKLLPEPWSYTNLDWQFFSSGAAPITDDWDLLLSGDLQAIATVTGAILPSSNNISDLGSTSYRFKDLYLGSKIDFTTSLDFTIGLSNILTVNSSGLTLNGNILGKYTVQPDTQPGFDNLTIITKGYVDNAINSISLIAGQGIAIPTDGSINVLVDNVTIGINTAGELHVIDLVDTWGLKKFIPANEIINVFPNYQYFIYGDLTVEGVINNYSEVVVANGALILQGDGQFNNLGDGLLKLVNLATGDSTRVIIMTFSTTAGVPLELSHNLGTTDFTYNVREGNDMIDVQITHIDSNTIEILTVADVTSANIIFHAKLT